MKDFLFFAGFFYLFAIMSMVFIYRLSSMHGFDLMSWLSQ